MNADDLIADFEFLDNWEDRYRHVIELGKKLPPFPEAERNDINKVQGCASQVWLISHVKETPSGPLLEFEGDSDAHIVRGLVAVLLMLVSGRTPKEIMETDILGVFRQIGLEGHLTPQRSNGLRSMVERIRGHARNAMAAA
ncbi:MULTISPECIES: SufE family protein [Xanthobacter]|uniref:Cysteine desufuration protein SufE n=1 Tax=Xanthobacter flavus TaxID=281 RepID=A0A9W6FJV2_XANFL|nr:MULTISPECIES: SufE family protein [Xanthobacter]MBN8916325.1 SufE family protein [Hyphomicrobiales bacterium]MDR6333950.1 cysteine desulfuration protein SufE [Xanthobacter flavus]NMN58459.1 cysteine desulfuration protein SufE [Xanthobacter sp. SG618]UDQ90400.1 SufE family protein [Xanthobacter autotrophicus]UJX44291.1 SufE family protein [Xanthobacter sp. YC-JY1]